MVASSTKFADIQNHWARPFIEALAQKGIVSGFSNGTFRPDQSMTRAQFAAVVSKAFSQPVKRQYTPFLDVASNHWAVAAIKKAYETGFLSGFPDNRFRPEERITRANALVSLVNGLGIKADIKFDLKQVYLDTASIPDYATDEIAIATNAEIVTNYPNLRLLNPTLAATRADVAAFVYQALVYAGQLPKIESKYIVIPGKVPENPTLRVSHQREFRGAWVTVVWNMDWPSKSGLSTAQQKAELIKLLDQFQALKFNAVIFQVRPEGDAVYASQIEPWSAWVTGTQGKPPEPFYDPLEFAIAECHKRNIELHAWFNPFRAKVSTNRPANVKPHISVTHPQYVYEYNNQLWMDPGVKFVQDRAYEVILDVVRRYDVDAIHLDDYFYPYPKPNLPFPDHKTYEAYKASGGKLGLADWRRENVNQLVKRLSDGIKATKPYVKFGISPFGIYRPGQPEQIKGLDAYNELYADSKKWLEQGWVDYFAPQLYWRIDQTAQSYPVLLKWWTENNPQGKHIYAGNNLGNLDGTNWKLEEIEKQVEITRNLAKQQSLGNIFFSSKALYENRQDISDVFKNITYARPALPPAMSWLKTKPPAPAQELVVKDGKLNWSATDNSNIRSWTVYKQNGNTWTLIRILPVTTTSINVDPGTYAVCAVDRVANESAALVKAVT